MILDFEDGACPAQWDVDVCVVGAGAAGLCLSKEFSSGAHKVLLLESGGMEIEPRSQALNHAVSSGPQYFGGWDYGRVRAIGGATTKWTGQSLRLMPVDFEKRAWVPNSGWPISYESLEPFYLRGERFLGLVSETDGSERSLKLDPELVFEQRAQITREPLLRVMYQDALEQDRAVNVVLHASVIELVLDPSGDAISEVHFRTLEGRPGAVRARAVVLATGGIENARLLLSSRRQRSAGLGNEHDQVGRYFQDHLVAPLGRIHGPNPRRLQSVLGDDARLVPVPELQSREQILNVAGLIKREDGETGTYALLKKVAHDVRSRTISKQTWRTAFSALARGRDLAHVLTERYVHGRRYLPGAQMRVTTLCEQAPDPENRVLLHADEVDVLGMPLAEIRWNFDELHLRTMRVAANVLQRAFARVGFAAFEQASWLEGRDEPDWRRNVQDWKHHIGTCRMSATPREGVVDTDCRVHSLANLYVAGSAVFPTGGHANPTLTIVALAVRLADHLKRKLASAVESLPGPVLR